MKLEGGSSLPLSERESLGLRRGTVGGFLGFLLGGVVSGSKDIGAIEILEFGRTDFISLASAGWLKRM